MMGFPVRVGGRIWKTVIAVFACFLLDTIRKTGVPFYAAIAAILCMQRSQQDSIWQAKNREIATIIGGIWGMLFLLFERDVFSVPAEVLRYAVLSLLLIPIIKFSVWTGQEKGTFLMCVVFLGIMVTQQADAGPVSFALNRILDATIGIITALVVNMIPWGTES